MFEYRMSAGVTLSILVCLTTFCAAPDSRAESKALLIGTGEYQNPEYNLTGIDLDLNTMRNVARRLGFADQQIRTLVGRQVTLPNLQSVVGGFLSQDTDPSDTVLIYYSGHGVQISDTNGDEVDNRDEALTLYDLRRSKNGYDGVLLDDDLSVLLDSLPSENVIMIVDACHSGTVTRGVTESVKLTTRAYGGDTFQVKALPFFPTATRSLPTTRQPEDQTSKGIVTLSAAQDNERALATQKGSTFTLALAESLETAGPDVSIRTLLGMTTEIIEQRVDRRYLFRPNLSGDTSLFDRNMRVNGLDKPPLSNWKNALLMASGAAPAEASLSSSVFGADETIELRFYAPFDGYLNVLAVDGDDSLILLHPNRYTPDNRVSSGWATLPGDRAYEWTAQPPWGDNLLVAIFTQKKHNLFETSLQKQQDGAASADYVLPFLESLQELGFGGDRNPPPDSAGAALPFKTCPSRKECR